MKWYEFSSDNGDGTSTQFRFKTREAAQAWRDKMETKSWWQADGDDSPVIEVDTDTPWFFHTKEEDDE